MDIKAAHWCRDLLDQQLDGKNAHSYGLVAHSAYKEQVVEVDIADLGNSRIQESLLARGCGKDFQQRHEEKRLDNEKKSLRQEVDKGLWSQSLLFWLR